MNKKAINRNCPQDLEKAHLLYSLDKDSKSAILNIVKELKEIMCKELKESWRTMSHQIETINKETDRNSGVEKYNNQIKSALQGLNSRYELEEENISEVENGSIEFIQLEEQKKKNGEK